MKLPYIHISGWVYSVKDADDVLSFLLLGEFDCSKSRDLQVASNSSLVVAGGEVEVQLTWLSWRPTNKTRKKSTIYLTISQLQQQNCSIT